MPTLLEHQAVAQPSTITGAEIEVRKFDEIQVECYHGFNAAVPNTNPGSFLLQTSITAFATGGNEDWVTSVPFATATGTPASEVLTANQAMGTKSMTVAATAGFLPGDLVYIRDVVVKDSEWAYIENIALDSSINLIDGLTRAHALTTTTIFGNAEKLSIRINTKAVFRVRMLYQHEGAVGADTHIRSEMELIETGN